MAVLVVSFVPNVISRVEVASLRKEATMVPASYVPAVIPEPVHTATVDETIDDTTKAWFMATLADAPTCPEIVTVSPTVNIVAAANVTVVDVADEATLCVTADVASVEYVQLPLPVCDS